MDRILLAPLLLFVACENRADSVALPLGAACTTKKDCSPGDCLNGQCVESGPAELCAASGTGVAPNLGAVLTAGNSASMQRIANLAAGVDANDAVTKAYVDERKTQLQTWQATASTVSADLVTAQAEIDALEAAIASQGTVLDNAIGAVTTRVAALEATEMGPGVAPSWTGWLPLAATNSWLLTHGQANPNSLIGYRQQNLLRSSENCLWFQIPSSYGGRLTALEARVRGSNAATPSRTAPTFTGDQRPKVFVVHQDQGAFGAQYQNEASNFGADAYGLDGATGAAYVGAHTIAVSNGLPLTLNPTSTYFVRVLGEGTGGTAGQFYVIGVRATIVTP